MSEAQENMPLKGKVAVITGAGRGIGRAVALAYANAGASVVCSARNETELSETVAQIRQAGGQGCMWMADVTQHTEMVQLFVHAQATFGRVDLVFANAGVAGTAKKVQRSDPLEWREVFEVNVLGTYNTVHAAIPHLRATGAGKIIVTGSGSRMSGVPGLSAYGGSKAAIWHMVQTLALELQEFNISVNELIPGPVKTALTGFGKMPFPAGEWVKEPDDVVPLAMFLAIQPDLCTTAQSFNLMRRV